jgi:hypothetical protein
MPPTPVIIKAVEKGDLRKLRNLIERGNVDLNMEYLSYTPLIMAAYRNKKNVAELLLRGGADVNRANYYGETALRIAASKGNFEFFKLLIDYGADINRRSNNGESILCAAANGDNPYIIKFLLKNGLDPVDTGKYCIFWYSTEGSKSYPILMNAVTSRVKKIMATKHGGKTTSWMELCNSIGDVYVDEIRSLIINHHFVHPEIAKFFNASDLDLDTLRARVKNLTKRQLCVNLARYYDAVKAAKASSRNPLTRNFSRLDEEDAANIISRSYKEHLYKPDVFLKSKMGKSASSRFR